MPDHWKKCKCSKCGKIKDFEVFRADGREKISVNCAHCGSELLRIHLQYHWKQRNGKKEIEKEKS